MCCIDGSVLFRSFSIYVSLKNFLKSQMEENTSAVVWGEVRIEM